MIEPATWARRLLGWRQWIPLACLVRTFGVALTDDRQPLTRRQDRVRSLVRDYEEYLISPHLTDALPRSGTDPARLAYERVRWRWTREMRPATRTFQEVALCPHDSELIPGDIKVHVKHILKTFGLKSRVEAAVWAVKTRQPSD